MNIEKVKNYFLENQEDFLNDLKNLIRIPSVSASGFDPQKVREAANQVAHICKEYGLENVEILELPNTHPYVYADWLHAKNAPTLLLYAHFDVQPPGDDSKWNSNPFEPTEIKDRLYGRGSADDKAGVMAHLSAIGSYIKTEKKLPINIKVIFEGEEEIGSEHLTELLEKHKEKLSADVMILTDTENYDIGVPGITTRLRGLVSVDLTVSVLKQPVHSGGFGGPLPDAIQSLAKIVAKLTDDDGKIAIPGIYEDVENIPKEIKEQLEKLPFKEEDFRRKSCILDGVTLAGEKDFSPHEQIWFRPSLSVNAIQASSKEQASNIIVDSAWCRIGIRTVPNMDTEKTFKQLVDFINNNVPEGVIADVQRGHGVSWWKTNTNNKAFVVAQKSLKDGFGHEPVFMGCGGSIGFVEPFSNALGGIPAILIGVEDPYTSAHSWNESLYIPDWKKTILSLISLYNELAS